jgi:CHAT domain-containing protein/tetratricopeptide (TPR) repeat protein
MTLGAVLAAALVVASRAAAMEPLPAVGAAVERELAPGDALKFLVTLEKGEFLRVVVEQRGVDVILSAFGPDGRRLVRVDRAGGQFGPEPISVLAERSGEYRIEIAPFTGTTVSGRFELSVSERRPAGAGDGARVAAEKQMESCEWPAGRRHGLQACRQAVSLWENVGDGHEVANALIKLGDLEVGEGRGSAALDAYEKARAAALRSKDDRLHAVALRAIGLHLTFSGDARRAAEVLTESVRLARASGHPQVEAGALQLLGWALRARGDYEKALEAGERAATLARERGDLATEAWAVHLSGLTFANLGDLPRGLNLCRRAAELSRAARDRRAEALALSDAGWIFYRAGRLESAEETLRAVADLQRAAGNRPGEALALVSLAHVSAALGRGTEAAANYHRALFLARAANSPAFEAHALSGLGRLAAASGDPTAARTFFGEELALRRRLEDPAGEAQAALALARLDREEGRLDAARERIEAALARIEGLRVRFRSPDVRVFASASSQPLYDFAVDVLMRMNEVSPNAGFDRLAFEMAERGRARELREGLAEMAVDPVAPGPLTLADVQATLPPDAALVSFEVDDARLFVFLVTRGSFFARRLLVGLPTLSDRVENALDLLSTGDGSGSRLLTQRLYGDLVAPWRAALPSGATRLVIVPDGLLARLPFEALEPPGDSSHPLVEEFEISYAPSASVLARLRERHDRPPGSRADLLVVADPERGRERISLLYEDEGFVLGPLPSAGVEARHVARFGGEGSVVLAGREANRARVSELSAAGFRVLHFATHGLVSQRSPSSSALALASTPDDPGNGLLIARDIHRLRISSELVVLSACQTARGRLLAGEGVQSLARAFLHAGAKSVVASLWNVNDEGAARFMGSFYRSLSAGRSKAAALRSAKLASFRRGEPPRIWAAFVLLGEPDEPVPLKGETLWARLTELFAR